MKMVSGEIIKKERDSVIDYVYSKVKSRINVDSDSWSHVDVKKYYNEVLISERLGMRNNVENRIGWFLSPFAVDVVSFEAYSVIPFLKNSAQFQCEMLSKVSPTLAKVPSDYGFSPFRGVPVDVIISEMVKGMTPWSIMYNFVIKPKFHNKMCNIAKELESHFIIYTSINTLKSVFPNMDLDQVLARPDIFPIAINLGFMLNYEKEKGHLVL